MGAEWDWVSPSSLVRIRGDEASITAANKAECRICEKEMRLVRQQLVIDRRAIDADVREFRARWKNTGRVSNVEPTFWGSLTGSYAQEERRRFEVGLIHLQQRREAVIERIEIVDRIILAIREHALALESSRNQTPVLPAHSTCPACGSSEPAGARFCGSCGARL